MTEKKTKHYINNPDFLAALINYQKLCDDAKAAGKDDPQIPNYIVSNAKIEATGFQTQHGLDAGIQELIKGFKMINNRKYGNV